VLPYVGANRFLYSHIKTTNKYYTHYLVSILLQNKNIFVLEKTVWNGIFIPSETEGHRNKDKRRSRNHARGKKI